MTTDYNAIQAINFSALKHIAESPRAYKHALDNPPEDSDVFRLGRLFHTMTLEPGKVDRYAVWDESIPSEPEGWEAYLAGSLLRLPDDITRRTGPVYRALQDDNPGVEWLTHGDADKYERYERYLAAANGREVIKSTMHDQALDMSEAVLASPIARQWLERATHIEQTLIWTDLDTMLKLKSRADMIDILGVCDLKGYREVTPGAMQKACNKYFVHAQIAMYLDGARACGLTSGNEGRILAVDKGPLYEVAPIILSDDYIEAGRRVYKGWLRTLADCLERDEWPGMYDGMEYLLTPNRWTPGMPEESDNDEIEV